jgi:hypothetical protein
MPVRLLLLAAVAALALLAPATARAAGYNCDASALRLTLASAPPVEPLTANRGAAACTDQTAGGALPATPLPLSGGALFARTSFTGSDPLSQVADAKAGLADLTVASVLPNLPVPALPGGDVVTVPGIGTVDLGPALAALVQRTGPLLEISDVTADVTAQCRAGNPALTGTSSIASLSVLGTKLSTTEPTERAIDAIDSQSIDPSKIDVSKVLAPTADLAQLQPALQPVLDALPAIHVPAIAAQVKVTPGAEQRGVDRLTRRALEIQVSLAGQSVLDGVLGEATVDASGADCGSVAAAALGCTTRRLTLIDVVQHGGHVVLRGAADPRRFAGKRVVVVSRWNGRTVARPLVAASGLFSATVALPASALRHTNRARYQARIGAERSTSLKLDRRMLVTGAHAAAARKVTLSGHITRPLGVPVQEISVTRRISCGDVRVVARFKPDAHGRFKVTLKGPRSGRVYTFRFRTKVRYQPSLPHLYRTYTLPQYVLGT